jgi:hypothetical protein
MVIVTRIKQYNGIKTNCKSRLDFTGINTCTLCGGSRRRDGADCPAKRVTRRAGTFAPGPPMQKRRDSRVGIVDSRLKHFPKYVRRQWMPRTCQPSTLHCSRRDCYSLLSYQNSARFPSRVKKEWLEAELELSASPEFWIVAAGAAGAAATTFGGESVPSPPSASPSSKPSFRS